MDYRNPGWDPKEYKAIFLQMDYKKYKRLKRNVLEVFYEDMWKELDLVPVSKRDKDSVKLENIRCGFDLYNLLESKTEGFHWLNMGPGNPTDQCFGSQVIILIKKRAAKKLDVVETAKVIKKTVDKIIKKRKSSKSK